MRKFDFFMQIFLCVFLAFFFIACAANSGHYAILDIKQDIEILPKFKPSIDKIEIERFKKHFFAPWHFDKKLSQSEAFWAFDGYLNKNYYFFNKQKIPRHFFEKAIKNANKNALLSLKILAFTTQNTPLRNLPSLTPILQSPFKDGEGIPFDYSLDSTLNALTPVLISHFTLDRRFAFVQSEAGWGFVEASVLREISREEAQIYENSTLFTPIFERANVYEGDKFLFEARVGAIFGIKKEQNGLYFGQIGDFKFQIASKNLAKFPLKFDDKNMKNLLKSLINRPYGWGGYDMERDCSALMRDIFAPFGLWLPRNSAAQSAAWQGFDVSALSNENKMRFIAKFAKPYETLLYLKGHIMLYVGVVKSVENSNFDEKNLALNLVEFDEKSMKIVAFHSIWGLRTKENGRLLIGKSALTSLNIGKDDSRVENKNLLSSRIEKISFLSLNSSERKMIEKALKSGEF